MWSAATAAYLQLQSSELCTCTLISHCPPFISLAHTHISLSYSTVWECDVPPRGSQFLVLSVSHCTVGMRRIREKHFSFERWRSTDTAFKGWWRSIQRDVALRASNTETSWIPFEFDLTEIILHRIVFGMIAFYFSLWTTTTELHSQ